MTSPLRVCFVCMGNICRSPLAEGIFRQQVTAAGLADRFEIESAGLGPWHVGDPPDSRARRVAAARGVVLAGQARQIRARDFGRLDVILALDAEIYDDLRRLAPGEAERGRIRLLRDFDPQATGDKDVPDPYYGDLQGFEHVFTLVERSTRGLLAALTDGARSRPEADAA